MSEILQVDHQDHLFDPVGTMKTCQKVFLNQPCSRSYKICENHGWYIKINPILSEIINLLHPHAYGKSGEASQQNNNAAFS